MKYSFLLIIIALTLANCRRAEIVHTTEISCTYSDSSDTHPKKLLYQDIIQRYIAKGLPGMTILANDGFGTWIGSGGYADMGKGIKFSPCHISKVASITKLFMGALTFKLQEEGKLNIHDPISKYIKPEHLSKIANAEGKTILHLMNHTTGIFDIIKSSNFYLAVINNPNKRWKQEELLKYVYDEKGVELGHPFNASYSNTNTLLLSMCIEAATGKPHDELLKEKILQPLGLSDTYYQGREEIPSYAAQGYYDLHHDGTLVNVSNFITGSGNGYGGIYSTIFDLQTFIKALFVNKTLLSQASLDAMQQFTQEDEDYYTGVGCIKKFTKLDAYGIGHTGRDLGYNANLFYFPQKGYTLIFLINYGTDGDSDLKPVFLEFEQEIVKALLK